MKFSYLLGLCFISLIAQHLKAQELVGAAGASGTAPVGSLIWSVGEPMTEGYANGSSLLTQGILQPQISIVTEVNELDEVWNLSIYPNPTSSSLLLSASSMFGQANFILTDTRGTIMQNGTIEQKETVIELGHLPASTYFLKITLQNAKNKTFKVNKL